MSAGRVGVEDDGFGDQIDAAPGSAGLKRNDAKQMQRVKVRGGMRENFFIEMLRFIETPLLVQYQALPERRLNRIRKCLL